MFACSVYELTPEFEANIRKEFADNIKRLRHHASLGLWCGNNEMEMFVDERCWVTKASEVRDYLFMYERIIPEVLREYDPETFTGRQAHPPEVPLIIQMIRTEETSITGRYGMETVPFLSTENTFSDMHPSLVFRLFLPKRLLRPLPMIRMTGICFPILWKSIRGITAQTERS